MKSAAQAIAIDPGLAEAFALRAQMLAQLNWDWEGAREDYDRALALAPGDADILRIHGAWFLAPLGRLPEAIAEMKVATELDPLSASAWATLGALQVAIGRGDDGERRSLARAVEVDPESDHARQALAVRHLLAGRPEAALDELVARYASPSAFQIAEVHAWRGNLDQAFAWLEKAWEAHDGGLLLLQWDPLLRNLRGDPRFASLQRRMNLPAG